MRLGDLDALKKNMEFICMGIMAGTEPYNAPLTEIDNAPTVDTTCPHCDSGYAQGYSDGYLRGKEKRTQDKWIPVSERLPEENGVYLVTLECVEDSEIVYEIDMAWFIYSEKDDCNNGFHKAYRVIAWQPLPEPYEKGGAE